jgi:hypothetical protein
MSLSSLSKLQSIFSMIVTLKIVVCTLKSAKLPVMNTQGALVFPVVSTLGSRLHSVLGTSIRRDLQEKFLLTSRPGSKDYAVY